MFEGYSNVSKLHKARFVPAQYDMFYSDLKRYEVPVYWKEAEARLKERGCREIKPTTELVNTRQNSTFTNVFGKGLLESLILKKETNSETGPQYHVHHGPCCASGCVMPQNTNDIDHHENNNDDIEVSEQHMTGSREQIDLERPTHTPGKRRLSTTEANYHSDASSLSTKRVKKSLLPHGILESIIDMYFKTAHHWIPFLHERRFRARLESSSERVKLEIVLHSMTYITIRLLSPTEISMRDAEEIARESKMMVLGMALDNLSVENLQALAMIAFEHVRFSFLTFIVLTELAWWWEVYQSLVHHRFFDTNCGVSSAHH